VVDSRSPAPERVTHFLPMSASVWSWPATTSRGSRPGAVGFTCFVWGGAPPGGLARFDTPGVARDVAVSGTFAFLADDREGLRVVDLAIPKRLQQVALIGTRDGVRALDLAGPAS
jgi:hypothetical protein